MKTMMSLAAAACVLTLAAADANAWQRNTTSTGPNGNSRSVESSGGCSGGTCGYSRSVTGPMGNTRTRSRTVTDQGDGVSWDRERSVNGPNGNTVTYGGSGSCSGGSCSYERGRSGPNGSVSRSGTVSRY
jgi:hypothetical protein